jgi:NADPH:quinone reductase-like Zn-dependent oxidoreductase
VTRFRPGDEVYVVTTAGSFAEYAGSRESDLARKPANLTFEQAAAVPISGMTALQGLRDVGRVQPGQQVLVIGAAGGVGSFAVQLAHAFGARGNRHVQHREDRPGPVHRRRKRDRLHPRGGRRAWTAV